MLRVKGQRRATVTSLAVAVLGVLLVVVPAFAGPRARTADTVLRCPSWFGPQVAVLACAEKQLTRALREGRFTVAGTFDVRVVRHGKTLVKARTRPGLAQGLGPPLRVGDVVKMSGRTPSRTVLSVRVEYQGALRVLKVDPLRLGRDRRASFRIDASAGKLRLRRS